MTNRPTAEQALKWLENQIELMGEFRNATIRDSGFKQWRQNTMTALQRIWPGQAARAQRFRRVPFAPPSARADAHEAHNSFERGFAEARGLLKLWEAEIKLNGLDGSLIEGQEGGEADVGPPTLQEVDPKPVAPARRKEKQRLKDMLGFGDWEPKQARPGDAADQAPPSGSRKRSPAPKKGGGRPDGKSGAEPSAWPEAGPSLSPSASSDALGQGIADALAQAGRAVPPVVHPASSAPAHPLPGRPGAGGPPPAPPAPLAPGTPGVLRIERGFGESGTRAAHIGAAHEIAILSVELGRLGVPDADRNFVGVAMVDLARHVDSGELTWPMLREAISLIMQYPRLACRALPLLMPYLSAAA